LFFTALLEPLPSVALGAIVVVAALGLIEIQPLRELARVDRTELALAIVALFGVLILGILAAVAVPKIINKTDEATDSGVAQSLAVIRDAIELYKAEFKIFPSGTQEEIKTKLDGYLQGTRFPTCQVGNKNSNIRVVTSGTFSASGSEGWAYDTRSGELIINSDDALLTDGSVKYSDL